MSAPNCPECNAEAIFGREYGPDAQRGCYYDGVSEWECGGGHRWGRWSGRLLADGEQERRYGDASGFGSARGAV